jgi:hypothetical protein
MATIFDPTHAVWDKGQIQTWQSELWLKSQKGLRNGIYTIDYTPEVSVLTWAMGDYGAEAPTSFDIGMQKGTVLTLAKCLNAQICKFNVKGLRKQLEHEHLNRISRRQITDPCSVYPTCQLCVDAPDYCGWCSVPVIYNGSIVGRNCAGVNKTITPPFNCTGSFSIQTCATTTTSTGTTASTTTSSTGTGTGTGSTTGPAQLFTCDPKSSTCQPTPNGQPRDVCTQQCTLTPIVPPVLQDKDFRGIEIDMTYLEGEWRAIFTTTNVTITDPNGKTRVGKVTSTAQFLTIHWNGGTNTQTLWQYQGGPATDYFSWAWGSPDGNAPANFDEAMNKQGYQEFIFVTCPPGQDTKICSWKK